MLVILNDMHRLELKVGKMVVLLGEVSGKVSPPNGFLLIVTSQTNFSFCLLFFLLFMLCKVSIFIFLVEIWYSEITYQTMLN